jgi:dolichol-phosphate mannosyltransferase
VFEILKRYERFLKFAAVGGSGIFVNLGFYALFTRLLGLGDQTHERLAAYALSVEISIVTNFLLNDAWTFHDRRQGGAGFLGRALRFHLVCGVGFGVNWGTFAGLNLAFPGFTTAPVPVISALPYLGFVTGDFVFATVGIVLATAWNYLGNLRWTWSKGA